MSTTTLPEDKKPDPISQNDVVDEAFEDEEEEDDDDDEDEEYEEDDDENGDFPPTPPLSREAEIRAQKAKMENLFRKISSERVNLRVHDVIVKGNTKTKDSLIEAELEVLRNATSVQELLQAAGVVNARLQMLDIFDSVNITLDSGPPELPGTANVIVDIVETQNPVTFELGAYTKAEARSSTFEGRLKYKNPLGYGDIWDGSLAYCMDRTSELYAGVSLPRFKGLVTPLSARVSLLSHDWIKFSSFKERALGFSLGLLSTKYHDLVYNFAWRTLTDPTQMASKSVRRQLGHSLLSSLKYTFKIDQRDSPVRPTKGFAFVSTTNIGGLAPDHRSSRFLRQEFDLRFALPFGFYNAALNFGISGGVLIPWGRGFLSMPSSLPERFVLGGNSSPVCTLGGPVLLGFKTRSIGPTEPRRYVRDDPDESSDAVGRDYLGGDLAVSAFADISFDLPLTWLRKRGVHGHMFACAGNIAKITENELKNFSPQDFLKSFRSSVGAGIIIPTRLFRMEVNYCYILKQFEHDRGKNGLQLNFSFPV